MKNTLGFFLGANTHRDAEGGAKQKTVRAARLWIDLLQGARM